tara:strand:+ start:912 stop:1604 length:693 start_codon:yes stop_codon:yes gene_type:complete
MIDLHFGDFIKEDPKQLLLDNGLVIVRDADINLTDFEEISEGLGKNLKTTKHVLNEKRTVQELSNDGLFGDGDVEWHHDWSYGRGNYFGTILYNVKNAHLSPTWFCDMSKAPDSLKKQYAGALGNYYPPIHLQEECFTAKQLALLKKQKVSREFVISHHVTNEEILYCSLGTIDSSHDWDLQPIKEHLEDNAYKHEWKEKDLLIWDNLKMNHKRISFEGERLLWRTQFLI